MNFDQEFLNKIKSTVPASEVVGRYVTLKRKGREFLGLSPFTNEKTPSFTVNNEKRFYHCFSSGKHGDIIDFVMEVEGVDFVKAIEIICNTANIKIERNEDFHVNRTSYKKHLECLKQANEYFKKNLLSSSGQDARNYLRERGINLEAVKYFNIGYSQDSFDGLLSHLKKIGFEDKIILEVGLAIESDDSSKIWDRFRGRITFPIKDDIGRIVAFGGRIINKENTAKYVNSPETVLFQKRKMLYNVTSARKAIHDKSHDVQNIIVCEGYLDVISLHINGIRSAVAPMGTALTSEQISKIWSYDREPVICFDGDRSGKLSSYKVLDNSIENLSPEKTMRFIFLEDGLDPDDYIKNKGKNEFISRIKNSLSAVDVLWDKQKDGVNANNPERIAGLRDNIFKTSKKIKHSGTAFAYKKELLSRFDAEFSTTKKTFNKPIVSSVGASRNFIPTAEFNLIGSIMFFPKILDKNYEKVLSLKLSDLDSEKLRLTILNCYDSGEYDNLLDCVKSELDDVLLEKFMLKRNFIVTSVGGYLAEEDEVEEAWNFNYEKIQKVS